MGDSYRIRTQLGVNKSINVQLDQDFDYLEILSLKIQQVDIYDRNCANYGVLVGRVTANNGFGIPNARVSLFVPIDPVDESNPIIQSIYPYKSPNDVNEDGYRYNLLPYEKSYSKHAATGTLPSRNDVLTGTTAVEIFDKYYKFTSKTNESGDYMIFGLPLGYQQIVMDVDLSDIGEFSLTPQDLIRMGLSTPNQVGGNTFRTSTDLNTLPQIINVVKPCDIVPLWGDPSLCQIAINRVDFDLREDANIDIQPTSVFMGSIFSAEDKLRVRPARQFLGINTSSSTRVKSDMGNLCQLTTGPGQILCVRQTVNEDVDGNPILEQYRLENSGNVIEDDGTWLIELPMNLDYVVTNEFGDKIISNDPTVGIPTKGKYRFKIKWQQVNNLSQNVRRPYYLVPNVKEYGWNNSSNDPNFQNNTNKLLANSYYFGLDWNGYTDGFTGQRKIDRLNEIINCEDTFYQFNFNKVYTIASLIDEYKNGGRAKFIGIKQIQDDSCSDTVNKFPVNEGFRNFDLIYFIFSILMYVILRIMYPVLVVAHVIIFLFNLIVSVFCWIFPGGCNKIDYSFAFPMVTYPDCEACQCKESDVGFYNGSDGTNGSLSYVSDPPQYSEALEPLYETINVTGLIIAPVYNGGEIPVVFFPEGLSNSWASIISQALAGNPRVGDPNLGKLPKSMKEEDDFWFAYSNFLPMGERINIFNLRRNYFNGNNKIKVTFASDLNFGKFHYDNTLTVLSPFKFSAGDLVTFVNTQTTSDLNNLFGSQPDDGFQTIVSSPSNVVVANNSGTPNLIVSGITGTTISASTTINVSYAVTQTSNVATAVSYLLPTGSTINSQIYPMDREYYQVITAVTVEEASKIWNRNTKGSFADVVEAASVINLATKDGTDYRTWFRYELRGSDYYRDLNQQYVVIFQRGVDPYSPLYKNTYDIGNIFGIGEGNLTFTANTRLNIPIQKINGAVSKPAIQYYTQDDMMFPSYFFTPGTDFSAFTSSTVGYYGKFNHTTSLQIDGDSYNQGQIYQNLTGTVSKTLNVFYGNKWTYESLKINPQTRRIYKIKVPNDNRGVTSYDNTKDLSGGSFMAGPDSDAWDIDNISSIDLWTFLNEDFDWEDDLNYKYYSKVDKNITFKVTNKFRNIMRTDRLPSSDSLNGLSWDTNPALLQQNNNFAIYVVESNAGTETNLPIPSDSTGAEQVQPDIEGMPGSISVLKSFDCANMVSLNCYQGWGDNFSINQECVTKDSVERGCYVFLRKPLRGMGDDLKALTEWSYRFRFFYGLCRGVLSESFTNNWVNGTLFMFPIQVNTYYDTQNNPYSVYPERVIYFDKSTTNFYVRSSPYNDVTNRFVGMFPYPDTNPVNDRNLLYPTTIVDLGFKDSFYSEILLQPETNGFIMDKLSPTSYQDSSDLLNFFVITRIVDENVLQQALSLGNNSIGQLFSRGQGAPSNQSRARIDGDLAQNLSINSELGVINFSPEYYEVPICDEPYCLQNSCLYNLSNKTNSIQTYSYFDSNNVLQTGQIAVGGADIQICANKKYGTIISGNLILELKGCCTYTQNPIQILGSASRPVMGIWFSSTTENLQSRDYMTPGRILFRDSFGNVYNFNYGIKSQVVPFYQWKLTGNLIFGTEKNNWATSLNDIVSKPYQSLDRLNLGSPTYFQSTTVPSNNTDYRRGYIFSVDANGNYSPNGTQSSKFIVGAPFHFYFGIKKGSSALDHFKTKYLADE